MNDANDTLEQAVTPADDPSEIDLAALTERYQRSASEGPELRAPAWVPEPLFGEPAIIEPRRGGEPSRRPGRFAVLLSAALFALGGVSVAFAAVRVTSTGWGTPAAVERGALSAARDDARSPSRSSAHPASEPEPEPEVEAAEGAEAAPAPAGADEAGSAVAPDPGPANAAEARQVRRRPRSSPEPSRASATPPAVRRAAAPEEADGAPAHAWDTGGGDDAELDSGLDELLDAALGEPASASAEASREVLPDTPTARQVGTTLRALEGEVHQCSERGDVRARIVIAGATGRVSSASVTGSHQAACIERVLQTARFPRFERETFSVVYPYRW